MSSRVGLNRNKVLMAAAEIVDRDGIQGLTVSGLATHLNVRPPSLYNHIIRQEYRFLAPQLFDAGFRVVTMGLRGHGESSVGWSDYSCLQKSALPNEH